MCKKINISRGFFDFAITVGHTFGRAAAHRPAKNNKGYGALFIFFLLLVSGRLLFCGDFFKIREDIIENSWKRVAFFYVQPVLTLENFGYTSNIYYYRDLEKPDWTADMGIKMMVSSIIGRRFVVTVDEHPFYSFYADNADQRAWSNRLRTAVYSYIGSLNLEYSYNDDFIKGSPTSEFGVRTRTRTTAHRISMDYGTQKNFYLNLYAGQNTIRHYEEDYLGSYNLKQSMNRKEMKAGIGLNKIIFTRTRLALNFEYYETDFTSQSVRNGIGRKLSLAIFFPEIGKIKGSAEIGMKRFTPGSSLYRIYNKPFGSGEVSIHLFKRFKFQLQYLVDNFYSYWQVEQGYNEKSTGARVEYYINKNIKLGYHYQAGILSYENLVDGSKIREDNFHTAALFLGLRLFKKMGIGLEYRQYRAGSDTYGFSRNNDFIGGYFIHEF